MVKYVAENWNNFNLIELLMVQLKFNFNSTTVISAIPACLVVESIYKHIVFFLTSKNVYQVYVHVCCLVYVICWQQKHMVATWLYSTLSAKRTGSRHTLTLCHSSGSQLVSCDGLLCVLWKSSRVEYLDTFLLCHIILPNVQL